MSGAMSKAFLDDIVAHIDDDTPRLVFADWLTENGRDDRAEFIRVQVERARLPEWDAAQVRLRLREEELLRQHGEAWLRELPAVEGAKWEGFRRGIVAEVSFASYEALRKGAHACRAVAPVEAVTVRWPRRREVGVVGPIGELRELSVTGRPGSQDMVVRLADSPQLATLRCLTARGLWPEALRTLVVSPHLARLRALRLPANNLGNAGILALIEAAVLSALEDLDLSGQGVSERYHDDPLVSPPGMEALANWPGLASVRSLNLCHNDLGRAGLRTLLRSRYNASLKDLALRASRLDGAALEELRHAAPGFLPQVIELGENQLSDVGVEHIVAAPCLRELKSLRLDRCEVPLIGAPPLAKAPFLDGLRVLDVGHNHFCAGGLNALLERGPPALHTLGLYNNDLYDRGAALLAGSPASDSLLEVDLSMNRLGNAAAQALAESPHLGALLVLRLVHNAIGEQSAAALAASPLAQRLAVLELETLPPTRPPGGEDDFDYDPDDFPPPPNNPAAGEYDIPF